MQVIQNLKYRGVQPPSGFYPSEINTLGYEPQCEFCGKPIGEGEKYFNENGYYFHEYCGILFMAFEEVYGKIQDVIDANLGHAYIGGQTITDTILELQIELKGWNGVKDQARDAEEKVKIISERLNKVIEMLGKVLSLLKITGADEL